MMMEGMDESADPCDDFYQLACGGWERKNLIPDDTSEHSTFNKLGNELEVILKGQSSLSPVYRDILLSDCAESDTK